MWFNQRPNNLAPPIYSSARIESIFQSFLKIDNLDPIIWPPSSPIVEAILPSFMALFADQGSFVNSISGYFATYSL